MSSEMQAPRRGWKWWVMGALVLAACGVAPEPQREEGSVSALRDSHGGQRVFPTWSTPTFASAPVLATDGQQFLTVWRDTGRPSQLFAARVSPHGELLDPEAIRLNLDPTVEAGNPAVAYDGRQFLVVWQGQLNLYLVRVNRDGTVEPPVLPIADIFGSPSPAPAIACGWRKCLVAWPDFADPVSIRGVIVESDDHGLGTREIIISSQPTIAAFGLSAAWGHDRFLVAWSDARTGTQKVIAARVKTDGTVLDPDGIPLSDSPGEQTQPDVVATKQGFVVAWRDMRLGNPDIFATLVKANGSVPDSDGFPIATSPDTDFLPALSYDGSRVLASWTHSSPDRISVRGNFVRADGSLASPGGFPLSAGEFVREGQSDVAFNGDTHFVVYGAAPVIDEPPFQVILGSRVKKNGALVDVPPIRISHSPSVEGEAVGPDVR